MLADYSVEGFAWRPTQAYSFQLKDPDPKTADCAARFRINQVIGRAIVPNSVHDGWLIAPI